MTLSIANASGFDLEAQSGSTVILNAGSVLQVDRIRITGPSSVLTTAINLDFPNPTDLELSDTATLNVQSSTTLTLGVFDTTNMQSGTVNLVTGSRLDVISDSVIVGAGVTLIKDGLFGSIGDQIGNMTIQSLGVVTHSARLVDGLVLKVTGTLDLQSGGLIDLNAKGLRAGRNGSAFGNNGETFNASGVIVSGATSASNSGAGASYGGTGAGGNQGGTTNAAYGLLEDALHLGSSGAGASFSSGGVGGHGGGRARINAGTFIVAGTLRANGGAATTANAPGGGGSGGSIRVHAVSLSGSGFIQALGGNSGSTGINNIGGAGGGGRIAIYYDAMTLPQANLNARAGNAGVLASAGTIYLKDNAQPNGDLIVDNGNVASALNSPLRTGLTDFRDLVLRNHGRLSASSTNVAAFTVEQPVELTRICAPFFGQGSNVELTPIA